MPINRRGYGAAVAKAEAIAEARSWGATPKAKPKLMKAMKAMKARKQVKVSGKTTTKGGTARKAEALKRARRDRCFCLLA